MAFELLANLDWIGATRALCETLRHGPFSGHTFYIDLDSGWSGAECEGILAEHGIGIYARCIAEGDAFFTVSNDQAEEAERLLLLEDVIAEGDAFFTVSNDQAEEAERLLLLEDVPLKYHLFSERNRQYLGGKHGA